MIVKAEAVYAKSEDQTLTNSKDDIRKHNGTKTGKRNREGGNGRPPKEEPEDTGGRKTGRRLPERDREGKQPEEVPDEEPKKNGKGTTLVVP